MKKPGNNVVLLLGGIHAAPANHDIREFTVRVYNSVHMLPESVQKGMDTLNAGDGGVLSNSELEEILVNLREHISLGYHACGVDVVLKEEDA